MEDGDSTQNLEKNIFRKYFRKAFNIRNVFQPTWIRCRSILAYFTNREFVVRKSNFVFYFGVFLWFVFIVQKIF